MGAATETDLRLYLTFPAHRRRRAPAHAARGARERRGRRRSRSKATAAAGSASPRTCRALARAAATPRAASRGTTFLSPFDSFLWHRERTLRLFGFDYRIEVYTPAAKRRFGYYTLPILCDGRLIGRVDAKLHRAEGRLALRHVAFEAPLARPESSLAGTAEAARSLAAFVGAGDVAVERVTPSRLAAPLRRALR